MDGTEDLVTENRYNTFGDLFQVVLPEGNVIEYSYDSAGRLLTIERKPDDDPASHGERVRYELNEYGQRDLEVHERWEMGGWVPHSQTVLASTTPERRPPACSRASPANGATRRGMEAVWEMSC